jgi:hypothetical protein
MVRSLVILTALSVLLGCGGADKVSGVQPSGVKTLTFANGNENQSLLQAWLDEVRTLSSGRLRIRVRSDWRVGERDFESGLIADVRSGRAQLGWVGTRAWTADGAHSFDALNAPFLVASYATEEAMLRGVKKEQLFAGVTAAGVEPVGLLRGPLRQGAPPWALQRLGRPDRGGAKCVRRRDGPERLQPRRPDGRGRARLLRARGIGFMPWFPLASGELNPDDAAERAGLVHHPALTCEHGGK